MVEIGLKLEHVRGSLGVTMGILPQRAVHQK